jgi:hypothetical protein
MESPDSLDLRHNGHSVNHETVQKIDFIALNEDACGRINGMYRERKENANPNL